MCGWRFGRRRAPPARGTRGRRTGRGRLGPPPVGPPSSRPRPKHTSQSPKVVIFFSAPLAAAMLVPEHAREMLVGLYRENSRFSRDLVGKAVVLDGGSPGSGDLGPATLFSSRQVVREGPGRVPWSPGALPARSATATAVPCGRAVGGAVLLPPPGARHLPKAAPPPAVPRLRPLLPWFQTVSAQLPFPYSIPALFTFLSPVAAVSFSSRLRERRASLLVSGHHLLTRLAID